MEASEKYFEAKIQNFENEIHEKELLMNQIIEESKLENSNEETKQQSTFQNTNNFQRKMLSAKEELQKSKEQAINESKMFLSKRLAELERSLNDQEKGNYNL
jgi:hypothetical protein